METSEEQKFPCNESTDNLDRYIEEVFRLMNNYESLVSEIQSEARQVGDDNQKLRKILCDENAAAGIKKPEESTEKFRSEYVEVADKIFYNLRNQILNLSKEKEMYETLWRNTAAVLEKEVPIHSFTQLEAKYTSEINSLRKDLLETKRKFEIQTKACRAMQQEQMALRRQNHVLTENLMKAVEEKEEAEQNFKEASALNKEQLEQSTTSFNKLCEATSVADEALAEAEKLKNEKRQLEDELHNLAETIGTVINSASTKVEIVVEELKEKHRKEKEEMSREIERLRQIIYQQESKEEIKDFSADEKIASMEDVNRALSENLQSALQTIESIFSLTQKNSRNFQTNEVKKLKKIIEHTLSIRRQFKEIVISTIRSLEAKVKELLNENFHLRKSRRS